MLLTTALSKIRSFPDLPKPGVIFRDITPLLGDGEAFHTVIEAMVERMEAANIQPDIIVCPEARGFIFGAALASRLKLGFVPIRKPGKLPGEKIEISYDLEYGQDTLQMHSDAIKPGQKVLVIDDVLATGGTMAACKTLLEKQNASVVAYVFLMTLKDLGGAKKLEPTPIISLQEY